MGKHVVEQRIANAHMVQYKCKTCGLRMMYVPRHGSSGKYRAQTPLTVHEEPTKEQIEKYTGIVEEKPTEVKPKTKKVAIPGEPIWDGKEETKKEYLKELKKFTATLDLDDSEDEDDKDLNPTTEWEKVHAMAIDQAVKRKKDHEPGSSASAATPGKQ